jgi:hypothetical protein
MISIPDKLAGIIGAFCALGLLVLSLDLMTSGGISSRLAGDPPASEETAE